MVPLEPVFGLKAGCASHILDYNENKSAIETGTWRKNDQKLRGIMAYMVLETTTKLHDQIIQDVLTGREAMGIVRDWLGEFMDGTANVHSWTPYWKEMLVRRPGNIIVGLRFRLGGPLEVTREHGWTLSEGERIEVENALIPLLNQLGHALAQRRVADAIQAKYPDSTRQVRNDDTILMQTKIMPPTAPLAGGPPGAADAAIVIYPDERLQIFVRCTVEAAGRATIRRFLADLQVAGVAIAESGPVLLRS